MRKQDKDLNVKPEALLWLDFETTGTDRDGSLPFDLNPDRWLSYRKFDLTTLRRYLTFLDCHEDPYKKHAGTHRVRDCIRRDINDYIRYRKLLKGAWR